LDNLVDALVECSAMKRIKLSLLVVIFLFAFAAACSELQVSVPPNSTPAVVVSVSTPEGAGATPTPLRIATKEYIIKPGETLTEIASRYGLTVEELAALNSIDNPNTIRAGQVIKVPVRPLNR